MITNHKSGNESDWKNNSLSFFVPLSLTAHSYSFALFSNRLPLPLTANITAPLLFTNRTLREVLSILLLQTHKYLQGILFLTKTLSKNINKIVVHPAHTHRDTLSLCQIVMLIAPVNPCGGIAGLFTPRRISLIPPVAEISLLTNSNDQNTLFTIPPMATSTTRASKSFRCEARRRVRDDGGGGEEDESYGYNEEIAMLEIYSQSCREEALIVTAIVDDEEEEVEVLIFKGVSSCLSGETAVDPARSVLPERAVIKKIDRVRGPFDPSQILYIQKGLSFQEFKETLITLK